MSVKKTHMLVKRRVWRYQRGNQNPYVEEEQTTQWPKEKVQKDKQRSTKHTYKTRDRVTQTPLKTGGELRCSGRVSSSCSTSGTRRVYLVTNPVISREWGKDIRVYVYCLYMPDLKYNFLYFVCILSSAFIQEIFLRSLLDNLRWSIVVLTLITTSSICTPFINHNMYIIHHWTNTYILSKYLHPQYVRCPALWKNTSISLE
jgi:hypothetical protein